MRLYPGRAGAVQASPIARLRHMNPLAIELCRRYEIDTAAQPLEFAVNNQPMNGGVLVDTLGAEVRFADGFARACTRPNRPFDEGARTFFERDWPDWLSGRIFDTEPG